jgi:hypothetical protein
MTVEQGSDLGQRPDVNQPQQIGRPVMREAMICHPRQAMTAAARFDARGSPIRNDHRFVT